MIMAPVSFAAFRSAVNFSSNRSTQGSVSFSWAHRSSFVGNAVGSSSRAWERLASIKIHLCRESSTFFPALEIALLP